MLPLWCFTILGSLLPPSQGLLNLGGILGSGPAQHTAGGLLGGEGLLSKKGGLLGTGLLGEGGLLGTGLLGKKSPISEGSQGLLGTENESKNAGVLGTGLLGGEGLLGTGLLSNKGLLGEEGLLGTGLLGKGGLVGNGSLLGGLLGEEGLLGEGGVGGLLGEGGPLGAAVPDKSTQHLAWLKMLSLDKARASWKVLPGGELVLNLYSKLTFNLPGIFLFLSGSSVETNITSHIALTQDTPGDLKLVTKDCRNLYGGIKLLHQFGERFAELFSSVSPTRTVLPISEYLVQHHQYQATISQPRHLFWTPWENPVCPLQFPDDLGELCGAGLAEIPLSSCLHRLAPADCRNRCQEHAVGTGPAVPQVPPGPFPPLHQEEEEQREEDDTVHRAQT